MIKGTVSVFLDSVKVDGKAYLVDYRFGKLKFDRNSFQEFFKTKNSYSLIVAYKNLPFDFKDSYSKFEILTNLDTAKTDSVIVAQIKTDFVEDIFAGSELEKSGSIFRGFTIGNNRDLTLSSGFRLQLNGKLSKEIDIIAALTDENTPIQPEGNTQKLQEIDKVFVELRSKNITATLGDIEVGIAGLDFFNFSKKVQGAKSFANFDKTDFFLSGSLERGRFNSNSFNGQDGVQGPYRLAGINNEINIVIIAGSEKIYLDGIQLARGESNDYTIDYSNGQIRFTNKRLITNASRIVADFEYSDKKYSRSMIVGQTKTSFFKDKLKLSFSYIRERDDKDKPIEFTLSDSDRTIISQAGDDRLKASKSGVNFVGRDSTGKPLGSYLKIDTLINSSSFTFYRFQPGDTNALYQVVFSFVGAGQGDYNSLSSSSYQFAGIKQGSYLPIIFFPMPVSYQMGDFGIELALSKSLNIKVESSVSNFDKNLFSSDDDRNNTGVGINSSLLFSSSNVKLAGMNFGEVNFSLHQKFINKLYNPIDRLNKVEYSRVWDIQDSSLIAENTTEGELTFKPKNYFSISTNAGRIKLGDNFNSYRGGINIQFEGDSISLPALKYLADYISSKDISADYRGGWLRQNGMIEYKFNPWKDKSIGKNFGTYSFGFQIIGEDKRIRSINADTTQPGSFRFYEFKPEIKLFDMFHFDMSYQFIYRTDDIYNSGTLNRQSNSLSHLYSIRLKDLDFLSTGFDVTVYDKKYTDLFKLQGFQNNRTVLVSSQTNLWLFDRALQSTIFYKVTSERTAKQEVVFVKVQQGQGNYKYLGDLNNNGIQDEDEFILVNYDGDYIKLILQTDQLFPTTDLQSSASISFTPSRFYNYTSKGIFASLLKNISFITLLNVNEKSKDPEPKNIYFLKFSKFLNEQNTIAGYNSVQQDVNILESNELLGFRLRFIQRKGFSQFFSGNEYSLRIERSARVRLSFTDDMTLNTDYVSSLDRNYSASNQTRNRDIHGYSVISDLGYRPVKNIEAGFKMTFSRANDLFSVNKTQADINNQNLRFIYSLDSKGKLRIEVERNEVILSDNPLFLPFELTNGKVQGKSYFLTIGFDYRISNFIQATVNYFGRAEGNSKVIHTGTAELRAFF